MISGKNKLKIRFGSDSRGSSNFIVDLKKAGHYASQKINFVNHETKHDVWHNNLAEKKEKKERKKIDFSFLSSFCSQFWQGIKRIKFKKRPKQATIFPREKKGKKKSLWSLLIVLMIIIIPFKLFSYFQVWKDSEGIIDNSKLVVSNLFQAKESAAVLDFDKASANFISAASSLSELRSRITNLDNFVLSLASLSGNEKAKLAKESRRMIKVGIAASSLGNNLSLFFDSILGQSEISAALALEDFEKYGQAALADAKDIDKELSKIKTKNLPVGYQAQFESLRGQMTALTKALTELVSLSDELELFLGTKTDRRYLLIFQNNNELRGPGGFMGSYALLDIKNGKIKNIEFPGGGTYDSEAGLSVLVKAPEPLSLVNPLWHFWDSNWWPDWPTSAQNIMWFYEKSDGPSVDGVISFTPTYLERILTVLGPIDLSEKYGVIINADNFWEIVQTIVEEKPLVADENIKQEPKKIIGDLFSEMVKVLPQRLNQDSLLEILAQTEKSLAEKHILFYFKDKSLEQKISANGWGGEQKSVPWDYLSVVNSNIAGGKTDRKIVESIKHQAEIEEDGSVIVDLEINRGHSGEKQEEFTGVRNVNWLRIYVPLGSEFLGASGFNAPDEVYFEEADPSWRDNELVAKTEGKALIDYKSQTHIYQENNKTVFANWSMVDPGQTAVIKLKYRLPFNIYKDRRVRPHNWLNKINDFFQTKGPDLFEYSLFVQKQPGSIGSNFSSELILPADLDPYWVYANNLSTGATETSFSGQLNLDQYYGTILIR
jgi:hypothetical protein